MLRSSRPAKTPDRRPTDLRHDALWLLTGLALGAAAVFATQPASAGVIGITRHGPVLSAAIPGRPAPSSE